MDWPSIIGLFGSGSIFGAGFKTVYERFFAKADRKRSEEVEAKKAVITLLPELSKAENSYLLYLSDSIYLNDLEGDVHHGWIPTIASVAVSKTLIERIESTPLHLLNGHTVEVLSNHASNFAILDQELSSMQSSHHYDYDDPGMIALNAKIRMERRLSDLILELHQTRKKLTIDYVGLDAWSKYNKARLNELRTLRRRAYGIKGFHDRFKPFHRWVSIKRVKTRSRIRKWWRELFH